MNTSEQALAPGDLERLDARRLGALNTLYSGAAITGGDCTWRWRDTRRPVDHWTLLNWGDRQLGLGIAAARVDDGIEYSWQDFEGDARRIAWCASYEPILELLQLVFQVDWVPTEVGTDRRASGETIDAGFTVYRAEQFIAVGRCRFDAAFLPTPATEPTPSPHLLKLPVAIPIVVDRAVLTVNELRELEIGAVVRVQRRAFLDIGATLRLRFGGNDILVKVTGTRLTVVRIEPAGFSNAMNLEREMEHHEDNVQSTEDDPASIEGSQSAPIDIAQLPVEVRFEAGRILTRYEELCRIQPGFTYELGHTLGEHTIDITANGALIARGELVSIGDQLGVRISALAHDPHAVG